MAPKDWHPRLRTTDNAEEFAVCIAMDGLRLSLGKQPVNGFTAGEIATWFALIAARNTTAPPSGKAEE